MKPCCSNFVIESFDDIGPNHHKNCPNYKTEKYVYLMYYEEAVDSWISTPARVDGELIITSDQLEVGETMEITFKRVDLTDEEYCKIPLE